MRGVSRTGTAAPPPLSLCFLPLCLLGRRQPGAVDLQHVPRGHRRSGGRHRLPPAQPPHRFGTLPDQAQRYGGISAPTSPGCPGPREAAAPIPQPCPTSRDTQHSRWSPPKDLGAAPHLRAGPGGAGQRRAEAASFPISIFSFSAPAALQCPCHCPVPHPPPHPSPLSLPPSSSSSSSRIHFHPPHPWIFHPPSRCMRKARGDGHSQPAAKPSRGDV